MENVLLTYRGYKVFICDIGGIYSARIGKHTVTGNTYGECVCAAKLKIIDLEYVSFPVMSLTQIEQTL